MLIECSYIPRLRNASGTSGVAIAFSECAC
jgi:hypothetical protein